MQVAWHRLVAAAGRRARKRDIAHVVGQPVEEVERIRHFVGCPSGDGHPVTFPELFAWWHGREPADDEWPAPSLNGVGYEWLAPEDAALATLVGTMDKAQIAKVLTKRLRDLTGDRHAERTETMVQLRINRLGLLVTDVVGGLTVSQAARELGSIHAVYAAIDRKQLRARKVGKVLVIPYKAWEEWRATRVTPPDGWVQLSSIREALAIRSDKLSEFARMGYIPTALRANPAGKGEKSTKFGTWFVAPDVAEQLVADRRAGRPMPWHGKPMMDNLRAVWKRWQVRKHPDKCETCRGLWGEAGAPETFEDFCRRYPPLAHGAKRHLTRVWSKGITANQLAKEAGVNQMRVLAAIRSGMLRAEKEGRTWRITRTDATRWKARKCPGGKSERSWIALDTAEAWYGFTERELRALIDSGDLVHRESNGKILVPRQQLADRRADIGWSEEEAAARAGVTVETFRELLEGVNWRGTGRIPLSTLQAVQKRIQSQHGYTIEEAAAELEVDEAWVRECIKDGVIRVARARWDRRRLYVTGPMLERLREELRSPRERPEPPSDNWLSPSAAAELAGLSTATIHNWRVAGEIRCRPGSNGYLYYRRSVMARARRFWKTSPRRRKRAVPPAWFLEEQA